MAIIPENESLYEDDNYIYIDHRHPTYHDIYNRWRHAMCSCHPPMMSDRMELVAVFFTASNFRGNNHGFNMNPGRIYPERAQGIRRRPTSNVPSNLSETSLVVSVKRASELMQYVGAIKLFARMLMRTYQRMGIVSNHDLFLALRMTRDNEDLEDQFVN